jgi:phage-related protein (TIGR01555 family)
MVDSKDNKQDGWQSVITGLNQSRDKRSTYVVAPNVRYTQVSEDRLVHGDSLAKRLVHLPAREMTREWFTVESDELDAGERADIMHALHKLDAKRIIKECLAVARQRGNALLFVGADDGQDPSLPLNLERVRDVKFLTIFDRYTAQIEETDTNPLSPTYNQPLKYRLGTSGRGAQFQGVGAVVHASRVIKFDGTETMQSRIDANGGWHDSIFVSAHAELRGYSTLWAATESLIEDFSQAVFKIKNLDDYIASNEGSHVMDRLEIIDRSRSVARAVVINADSEEFTRQATPMGGLPEVIDRMNSRIAGAFDMPITLLLGESPGGLNSTGEGQARQWANQVRNMQEYFLLPGLEKLLRILLNSQSGPTGGNEPEAWEVQFNNLFQETPQQQADSRLKNAQRDVLYIDAGVVTPSEVALSRFGGDVYSSETVIETDSREELKDAEIEELLNPPEPPPVLPQPPVAGQEPEQDGEE